MKYSASGDRQNKHGVINQTMSGNFDTCLSFKVSVIKHGLVPILSHRRLRVIIY